MYKGFQFRNRFGYWYLAWQAYCDMRSGTTRLDHGLGGGEHRVSSCGEAGCSVHRVAYDAPMKQVAALTALSARCEQHVKVGKKRARQPSVSRSILILILP